jgi:hypothetical protein
MHINFKIIKFYFTFLPLDMFRTPLCPSSGAKAAVTTEQGWRKQPTQHHTVTRDCMCSNKKLLMMGTMVSETCRAALSEIKIL